MDRRELTPMGLSSGSSPPRGTSAPLNLLSQGGQHHGSFGALFQRNAMAMASSNPNSYEAPPSHPPQPGAAMMANYHHPYPQAPRDNTTNALVPMPVSTNMVSMGFGIRPGGPITVVGRGDSPSPLKKKRGRPRKYGPDGSLAVPRSTLTSHQITPLGSTEKRGRGRPRGSGHKQQLAALGECLAKSAGYGFTPHIVTIDAGEWIVMIVCKLEEELLQRGLHQAQLLMDVAAKIMAFSQQGPRSICILSANGAVSNVTLRQTATSGGAVSYEGRFEILSLAGSFLLTQTGETKSRSGGLSISLSGPDGQVLGGGVAGMLTAASPVQIVVGSFLVGGSKSQTDRPINAESSLGGSNKLAALNATPVGHDNDSRQPGGSEDSPS